MGAVREAQRRQDEIAGAAEAAARLIQRAKHQDLMGEFIDAGKAHMAIFVIVRRELRPVGLGRRIDRRRGDARRNLGDQRFLPGEAVQLPKPQADEDRQGRAT